ncbi:hypothetical protein SAMN05443549_10280 [Flavobacterium fluvii]|uniref:DUF4412 domain-containing protein n=1 Tax=Flavobacterium fluvii TaxID=468056 RepID=A0A1M5H511_9FLAO|nr:hypothetical protein [Flavobacterium fluvii]SHG10998.1 hypothetical protein SAMN05443549_10280 [Flavobacterium fluvii]
MRKIVLILTALFFTITTFSQNFEGKIMYTNTYKTKNTKITDQQWSTMLGATQEYFIKGGDYKSVTNGTFVQWQQYSNTDNKLYIKMANSETLLWNDGSIQGDEVLKVEVNKKVIEILGYKCDEVILTCTSGVQKYYFNTKLSVNPKLFVKHKFGNWADYLSKSKSLPLKSIIDTAQFTLESIATEVKPTKLDPKMFELPAGAKTAKSPY